MASAFPTLDEYLAQLPNGLDSFPSCTIKASVMRDALAAKPVPDDPSLPEPIRAFLQSPPPVSSRVPEVLSNALLSTLFDVHFGGRDRQAAYDWTRASTRALLRTPLYRVLFAVLSPERLLNGAAHRWHAFRQGTDVVMLDRGRGFAQLELTFPLGLHSDLTLFLLAAAFQAAVDCTGARENTVDVTHGLGVATFSCRWVP